MEIARILAQVGFSPAFGPGVALANRQPELVEPREHSIERDLRAGGVEHAAAAEMPGHLANRLRAIGADGV